jgi:hypothetical protein
VLFGSAVVLAGDCAAPEFQEQVDMGIAKERRYHGIWPAHVQDARDYIHEIPNRGAQDRVFLESKSTKNTDQRKGYPAARSDESDYSRSIECSLWSDELIVIGDNPEHCEDPVNSLYGNHKEPDRQENIEHVHNDTTPNKVATGTTTKSRLSL